MNWFNVPGQFCPIAMGSIPCETNYDCTQKLNLLSAQNPACSQLTGPTTGLGWTDAGAVQNSAAGKVTCHPFRNVCTMENFEIPDSKDFYRYLIIIIGAALIVVLILSFIVMNKQRKINVDAVTSCISAGYNVTRK